MQTNHSLLWRSFIDGNRQSLEAIYNLYYEMLYEYGVRRTGNDDWVRDCIQEVFVKLWIGRSNINTNANVRFYLLRALKNQLLDYHAALQKNKHISLQNDENFTMQFSIDANDADPLRQVQLNARTGQLLEALNQLSDRQKEVIYLKYFAELDNAEVAELLDINVRAVYKLTARALEALRTILQLSKEDLLLLLLAARTFIK